MYAKNTLGIKSHMVNSRGIKTAIKPNSYYLTVMPVNLAHARSMRFSFFKLSLFLKYKRREIFTHDLIKCKRLQPH